MQQERGGFSVGWMLISYFMIAGGFMLAGLVVALLKVQAKSEIFGYILLFSGAAFGGFFAGRASPGKTILEPAVGGVLLFASIFALTALVPGARAAIATGSFLKAVVVVAVVVGAGGLIGGILGERTQSVPSNSPGRWAWISALVTLGALFVSIMFFAIVLMAGQENLRGGSGVFEMFLMLSVAAFLGGLVTQAAAPEKMIMHASLGMPIAVVAMVVISIVAGTINGSAFIGVIIVGLGGWAVAAIGAHAGWAVSKDKKLGGAQVDQVFE